MIAEIIKDFDIFLISESKLDSTFPNVQFKITGFKNFRYDRNLMFFASQVHRFYTSKTQLYSTVKT